MVTTKTKSTVQALRNLYGPGIPIYPGSPHEEDYVDDAELVLHELGHLIQNPKRFPITPYNVNDVSLQMGVYISRRPPWKSDLHEIRAVAIELVAARKLGIRLTGYRIIANSLNNTKLYYRLRNSPGHYWETKYSQYIARAKKLKSTQRYANAIVKLVERERKKLS